MGEKKLPKLSDLPEKVLRANVEKQEFHRSVIAQFFFPLHDISTPSYKWNSSLWLCHIAVSCP